VVQDGRDSLRSASGVADLCTGRPMRADLRFRAGSATKPLVATVVLKIPGFLCVALSTSDGRRQLALMANVLNARRPCTRR
jgi:hypothetical protein